jgi:hypothetical protein
MTDVPARIGAIAALSLDTKYIRRGMTALIRDRDDQIISRAIVDDIRDGQAKARILSVAQNISTITSSMRIEVSAQMIRGER